MQDLPPNFEPSPAELLLNIRSTQKMTNKATHLG